VVPVVAVAACVRERADHRERDVAAVLELDRAVGRARDSLVERDDQYAVGAERGRGKDLWLSLSLSIHGSLWYGDLPALDGVRVRHIARQCLREALQRPDTAKSSRSGTLWRCFRRVELSLTDRPSWFLRRSVSRFPVSAGRADFGRRLGPPDGSTRRAVWRRSTEGEPSTHDAAPSSPVLGVADGARPPSC
jgi:hypothetical protein